MHGNALATQVAKDLLQQNWLEFRRFRRFEENYPKSDMVRQYHRMIS